ncbi:hypothetical protein RSK60_2030013 [Ralstonia solanacearum K60]|nr:hypothetical protein RSK60_2030013 [Ralstonia solanacearum K60]
MRTAAGTAQGQAKADGTDGCRHAHRDRPSLHEAAPHPVAPRPPQRRPPSHQARLRKHLQRQLHGRRHPNRIEPRERHPAPVVVQRGGLADLHAQQVHLQAEMREGVREHASRFDRRHQAVGLRHGARFVGRRRVRVERRIHVAHQGQRPQPAPDTALRPALQQHRAIMQRHQQGRGTFGDGLARTRHGQFQHAPGPARFAQRFERTGAPARQACRLAARTDGGTEVHQTLRVRLDAVRRRQHGLGNAPHRLLDALVAGKAVDAEDTRKHALDVAVEDGRAHPVRECRNGRGGGASDARQRRQCFGIAGKHTAMLGHHDLRAAVQIARAGVVAQARPGGHHVVRGRRGQRPHGREPLDEARVVAQHRRHLRLLQHDLRQPHAIGIAGVLPRQVMAAMAPLPGNHADGEIVGQRRQDWSGWRGAARAAGCGGHACNDEETARRRTALAGIIPE